MPVYKRKRRFSLGRQIKRKTYGWLKQGGIRRPRSRMRGRLNGEKVYTFNRGINFITNGNNITYTGGATSFTSITVPAAFSSLGFGYAPCLNDIINDGEFTDLFDQYKITRATFKFRLTNNPDAGTSINSIAPLNAANVYPLIYLFPDHDDIVVPTVEQCRERQVCCVKC